MNNINIGSKKYENFVKNSNIVDQELTVNENSEGVLITKNSQGVLETTIFGSVSEHTSFKNRIFTFVNAYKTFEVNGHKVNGNQEWIPGNDILAECFVEKSNDSIKIVSFSEGYVYVNKSVIVFKDIKNRQAIPVKNKNNELYFKAKDVESIYYNGKEIYLQNNNDKYLFPDDFPLTDNMFLKYTDGSFSDLFIREFKFPDKIYAPVGENFYDITRNFRCKKLENFYRSETHKSEDIEITINTFNHEKKKNETKLIKTTIIYTYKSLYDKNTIILYKIHEMIPVENDFNGIK